MSKRILKHKYSNLNTLNNQFSYSCAIRRVKRTYVRMRILGTRCLHLFPKILRLVHFGGIRHAPLGTHTGQGRSNKGASCQHHGDCSLPLLVCARRRRCYARYHVEILLRPTGEGFHLFALSVCTFDSMDSSGNRKSPTSSQILG